MAKKDDHEFHGEHPHTHERVLLKTGEHVKEDGAYFCLNCVEEKKPPMVNLKKGDMIPVCHTCTPNARWTKV